MKKFIVDTGDKKYKVEANTYDEAISAVKVIQAKKAIKDAYVYRIKNSKGEYEAIKTLTRIEIGTIIEWKNDKWTVTNFLRNDAITDEASPLQTVNALLEDERAAVDAYNVALENLKGKIPDESYAAIEAIRNDENRHIENLQAVVNGNVTEKNLEDSVKDAFVARLYKSSLDNQRRRVQLLLDGKEVASLTQNEARTLAAKILELANSATN